jgi:Tfp pilus assembly protein PilN
MIKVNLLRDHTSRSRKKTYVKPTVSRTGLILAAIVLLAAGVIGAWTLVLHQQVQTSNAKRSKLRTEEARLKELNKEAEKFDKLKTQCNSRIDAIERLKASQTGPVLLLNNIIQSIPRDGLLWLTSLTQNGQNVKIVGSTQQTEVIPDFITNLMTCGMFQSVDLEMIESQKEASKFSLVCITGRKTLAELKNGH